MPDKNGRAVATLILDLYHILVDTAWQDATYVTGTSGAGRPFPERKTTSGNSREPLRADFKTYNRVVMLK